MCACAPGTAAARMGDAGRGASSARGDSIGPTAEPFCAPALAGEDFIHAEEFNLQPLEDDCKLLGSLLDDTLKTEVGAAGFAKLQKIRCG